MSSTDRALCAGYGAYLDGQRLVDNPYKRMHMRAAWQTGFCKAFKEVAADIRSLHLAQRPSTEGR